MFGLEKVKLRTHIPRCTAALGWCAPGGVAGRISCGDTENDASFSCRLAVFALLWCVFPGGIAAIPAGIPAPPLDLSINHRIYDGKAGYGDAGAGPYTHYVDNRAENCSDEGPGTAATPRCRLPKSVEKGAVIEVHGGPYTHAEYPNRSRSIRLNGTSAEPVFLRAVTPGSVVYRDTWLEISGQHFVVENLALDGTPLTVGRNPPASEVIVRNVVVENNVNENGVSLGGQDIVFMDSHVHHNYGDDLHGVFVASKSKRVWILNNRLNHNGGDGIQFCHNCQFNPPRYVYIGGNNIYSNRENGVDLKYSRNVLVASNRIYKHRIAPKNEPWCFDDGSHCGVFSSGSDGSSIVVGSDGGPIDVAILYNEIYDSNNAIRVEEGEEVLIANNLMFDLDRSGLVTERQGGTINFVHNTLFTMESGIRQKRNSNYDLRVSNNLFTEIDEPLFILDTASAETLWLDHNLFWNAGAPIDILWGSERTASNSAGFNSLPGRAKTGNLMAEPGLQIRGLDTYLLASGAAVNAGNQDLIALDAGFQSHFPASPSILADIRGRSRVGCALDIGAEESRCGEGDGEPPPEDDPGDDDEEPPEDPEPGPGGGGGDPVDGVLVTAELAHDPVVSTPFSLDFSGPQTLVIPQALTVVGGEPGKGWATLALAGSNAQLCFYRGDGKSQKTKSPCSRDNGDAYLYQYCVAQTTSDTYACESNPHQGKCKKRASELAAGTVVRTDGVALELLQGDSCATTVVETVLAENGDGEVVDLTDDAAGDDADPGEQPGGGGGDGGGGEAVQVRAERHYEPSYAVDFNVTFNSARDIALPYSLPVTMGKPGRNWAALVLDDPDAGAVCFYRGNGKSKKTSSPCERENGDAYEFEYCVPESVYESAQCGSNPQAGSCKKHELPSQPPDLQRISGLHLSLLSGDSCGSTVVEAELQ